MIPRTGFGWAGRTCAFLILALLVVANLTVRSLLPPSRKHFDLRTTGRPLREVSTRAADGVHLFFYYKSFVALAISPSWLRSHRAGSNR